jgi:hypothetical protein
LVAANCGSISRKTAPGHRASSVISDHHRIATTTAGAMAEAATTGGAATVARSTGRRSRRAAAEGYAARSEASSATEPSSSERPTQHEDIKNLGRGVNPARAPVVLYPEGV